MQSPYPDVVVQCPDVVLHILALAYLTLALVLAYFDVYRIPATVAPQSFGFRVHGCSFILLH